MNYSFIVNKYIDAESGVEKCNPLIQIENQEKYGWYFIDEINNLSSDHNYVIEIVSKLDSLLKGQITFYDGFGYEVYVIECNKDNAYVKNVFSDDKIEAVIPTREIYELMRDWRDYLIRYYDQNKMS